ncbi:MAG: DUF6036 family nucleotidyltransferase [Chloroflexota bacterium]
MLRAASDITRELEFLVVGSAAILGSFDDQRLPKEATRSREGDITPYRIQDREVIDRIEIYLGEGSRFAETNGYFADAVDRVTSKPPTGWEQRLIRFSPPDANGAVAYCLEPHDCVGAKLGAGRDKDYEFAEALLAANLVQQDTLLARVQNLPRDTGLLLGDLRRAERWVAAYGKPAPPEPATAYALVSFTSRPGARAGRVHTRARGEWATLCGRVGGRTGIDAHRATMAISP